MLLTLVHKGQHTELKSVEQFNKLLAGLDKNAVITLQVRRGEKHRVRHDLRAQLTRASCTAAAAI